MYYNHHTDIYIPHIKCMILKDVDIIIKYVTV